MAPSLRPTATQTAAAAQVIAHHLEPSRLCPEPALGQLVGAELAVKYEFFNPVRSFKMRGALNLAHHLAADRPSCVFTASTGNRGSAMALACGEYDIPLTVVVPQGCDESKVALMRRYRANWNFSAPTWTPAKNSSCSAACPRAPSSSRTAPAPKLSPAPPPSAWNSPPNGPPKWSSPRWATAPSSAAWPPP